MAANYLHGIETIEVTKGGRPVKLVKSSVIGLVGTAPIHHVAAAKRSIDRPVQVLSDKDAVSSFGPELTGYTIPQALERVRKCGRGVAIVVNVFDPARHYTEVTDEALALPASGSAALARADIISLTLTVASSGVALVAGSDYELEPITGTIRRLSGSAIPAASNLLASYRYANPGAITAGDIIGTVNAAGLRTGMQAWLDSYSQFGYFPKNLIAPAYGSLAAVRAELDILARRLRGHAFVDAPVGTAFAQALAERGPAGTIFNTSSERVVLCWPHVQEYDAATNSIILAPLSCYAAGVMAETDIAEGYWVSPSNHEIPGIVGLETPVTAMINDPNSEANLLNEAGIMTVFNAWGSGFRLWGNRSAAFPASTVATNFIAVRRTLDVIHESVEYAMLQFLDGPLDPARVDAILATTNALVRKLIADGALIDGRYRFDPAENTEEELSAGHLVLTDDLTPPSPLERLTFKSSYSTAGLRALYAALAA